MTNKSRKPYQKPQIRRVKLVAEEAVLVVCKTATLGQGQGISIGNCVYDGFPEPCINQTGT